MPIGASIGPPRTARETIARRVWLKPVEISDWRFKGAGDQPFEGDRMLAVHGLTLGVQRFLAAGNYFERVTTLPGKPGPEDLIFAFQLSEYHYEGHPHPAYVIGSLLTGPFYVILGGPWIVFEQKLRGTLVVEDVSGVILVPEVMSSAESSDTTTFYDPFVAGVDGRTRLFQDLVDKALAQLRAED
jgi:hypothetical protein